MVRFVDATKTTLTIDAMLTLTSLSMYRMQGKELSTNAVKNRAKENHSGILFSTFLKITSFCYLPPTAILSASRDKRKGNMITVRTSLLSQTYRFVFVVFHTSSPSVHALQNVYILIFITQINRQNEGSQNNALASCKCDPVFAISTTWHANRVFDEVIQKESRMSRHASMETTNFIECESHRHDSIHRSHGFANTLSTFHHSVWFSI